MLSDITDIQWKSYAKICYNIIQSRYLYHMKYSIVDKHFGVFGFIDYGDVMIVS